MNTYACNNIFPYNSIINCSQNKKKCINKYYLIELKFFKYWIKLIIIYR